MFVDKFWAIIPAIIAIIFALITKEVYVSLFIGIVLGAFLICDFNILNGLVKIIELFASGLGIDVENMQVDSLDNIYIVIFLILLGIIVVLVNRSGGSRSYGNWSSKTFKSKKGVLGATIILGTVISVDDYFNNLTVGSIMTPVADIHKISRTKLAYVVSSVAAPICILCPISSWAVTVTKVINDTGLDGFSVFVKTIPLNLYALFTIIMLIALTFTGFDFFSMKKYEKWAMENCDKSSNDNSKDALSDIEISNKGKVVDLIIPIVVLIISSIFFMLYTGGLFDGSCSIMDAFGNSNSGLSLCGGAMMAIITCAIMYLPRKVISYKEFTECITLGFKSMTGAILILVLAWTLNCVCQELMINSFVNRVVTNSGINIGFIPAVFFIFSLFLAFSTGTSWGTFTILIPLVVPLVATDEALVLISISAVLSGSVCGDHISPISDTTILSSTSCKCDHLIHVKSQMPYCLMISLISFLGFIFGGFVRIPWLIFVFSAILFALGFTIMYIVNKKMEKDKEIIENNEV